METFPLLRDKIAEEYESVHFRMVRFADYTIEQIKKGNIAELNRCFDFQESMIRYISAELENALTVSYCESLMLGSVSSQMDEILKIMPDKLQKHYLSYKKWHDNLVEKSRKD